MVGIFCSSHTSNSNIIIKVDLVFDTCFNVWFWLERIFTIKLIRYRSILTCYISVLLNTSTSESYS